MEYNDKHSKKPLVSEFDITVMATIILLVTAIAIIFLLGDHIGVQIIRVAPIELAHSTDPIAIQFSEAMNRESASEGFSIEPDIEGEFSWNADTLFFQPNTALQLGETYTVTINAGVESQNQRQLLENYQFTFSIRQPRIAYLAPSNHTAPQNIFLAYPDNRSDITQVTFSTESIFDFAVSPDGRQMVYAEYEAEISDINLHLLTLETGEIQQITTCENATCTSPVWKPDGTAVVYQRVDNNSFLSGGGFGSTNMWLTEFTATSFDNRPLFEEFDLPSYSPRWSADGNRIAVFDPNGPGTVIYDFIDGTTYFIPSYSGNTGALSPNGNQVAFAQQNFDITTASRSYIQLVDLPSSERITLTEPDVDFLDSEPIWHPNGRDLTFIRRYPDDSSRPGSQLYLLNTDNQDLIELSDGVRYANNSYSWDPTGTLLGVQRFPILDEQGQRHNTGSTEIWVYNLANDEWYQIATGAYLPQWVP